MLTLGDRGLKGQSSRGLEQSKTLRVHVDHRMSRQRLELR